MVQDAVLPAVGHVPSASGVKAVLSAVALAMGVAVEFRGAASSDDLVVRGAGNSDAGRAGGCLPAQMGAGLPPVKSGLAADPATTLSCPEEGLDAGLEDGECGLVAEPDASTLCPEEGLVTYGGVRLELVKRGRIRRGLD